MKSIKFYIYLIDMKNVQLRVFFWIMVLVTPLIFRSMSVLIDDDCKITLCEKFSGEEESEERESENKGEKEDVEKIIYAFSVDINCKDIEQTRSIYKGDYMYSLKVDVLTPPPEL